ncbi:DUF4145 domain-containing protein [Rhizobiaceae bacterium n13]|uniref:DUF4145 domain-containing protein n=1 Tax=Ferirhizobium litorale TaxID=2927786 RepID=UPI0024B30492|nr:DUF4145 domain-containing protein [Fererhizobium litorale]MDI7862372.1 DUF4145 domain-containing protein [Fererhizobium litorale]
MDRAICRKSTGSFVRFDCPRCGKGKLKTKADTFVRHEPTHVTNKLEADELKGELSWGRFSGYLVCNAPGCGEMVVVAGDFEEHYHYQHDEETGDPIEFTDTSYKPRIMHPAPPMIEVPKKLGKEAKEHMTRAFELFWSDAGACANRMRIVVELLLDQLEIPRKRPKGKAKNAHLNLSDRITILKDARPGHDKALTALRIVGNIGSHEGVVEFEELLDCFELLEDALIELLERRRENLDAKAQRIIDRRGKNL